MALTDGEREIVAELNQDAYPTGWCFVCEDEPTDECQNHTQAEYDAAEDRRYREEMEWLDHKAFGFWR